MLVHLRMHKFGNVHTFFKQTTFFGLNFHILPEVSQLKLWKMKKIFETTNLKFNVKMQLCVREGGC